ncbi:hypothetical protein ACET3Z_007367 [Daucus carota]
MRSMECTGLVADKFAVLLAYEETLSNSLNIPTKFSSKYSNLLHKDMELKLRNGYTLPVEIDLVNSQMRGVKCFFKHLELRGGELILFEYFGRSKFNVYIIGSNGSEIQYPEIAGGLPAIVTIGDAGWRFVIGRSEVDPIMDEIDPPAAFIARCGFALPERIIFVLCNGKRFVGAYNSDTGRLSGFSSMLQIIGKDDLNAVKSFLFTYDGTKFVSICAFDCENAEIVFPGTPVCMDADGSYPIIGKWFRITVESKHMFDDSFMVEISNEFSDLCLQWEAFQCINVYSGNGCWRLLIRKRENHYCYTIEDGWQRLRDDLRLNVGNVCIFRCPRQCYDQFQILVARANDEE